MNLNQRATETGISRQTLSAWKKAGTNVFNDDELRARIGLMQTIPAGVPARLMPRTAPPEPGGEGATLADLERRLLDAVDYGEARVLRCQIAGLRDVVRTRKESGDLISRATIGEERQRDGYAVRQMLLDLLGTMPPILLGQRDEAAIQAAMKPALYRIMAKFNEGHVDYWPDPLPAPFRTLDPIPEKSSL